MRRTNLFLKVEVEHERDESAERIADAICRKIAKMYGVRLAEATHFTPAED